MVTTVVAMVTTVVAMVTTVVAMVINEREAGQEAHGSLEHLFMC